MVDTLSWKDKSPENILRTFIIGLPTKIRRIIINRYTLHLWTNWEKEVVSSAPTITVSDKIAEELRVSGNTNRVFVVPNFPMKSETENIEKPHIHTRLSSVYAGSDGLNKQKIVYFKNLVIVYFLILARRQFHISIWIYYWL